MAETVPKPIWWRYAVLWNAAGDSIGVVGPGAADSVSRLPFYPNTMGVRTILLTSDSTVIAMPTGDQSLYLQEWRGTHHRPLVSRQEVWSLIDPRGSLQPADSGFVWEIVRDESERVWGISLWLPPGEWEEPFSAALADRRTILWVTDRAGALIDAVSLPRVPARGFVDGEHFFGMREEPNGLLVTDVTRFGYVCE